ncbi:PEP-CTERM sorting domain-containing protein [Planktothrix sp.]
MSAPQSALNFTLEAVFKIASIAFATLGTINPAQAIITIDTTPGNSFQGPFGEPASPFFGQTLTVPENDNVLTDFTFFIEGFNDVDSIDFVAIVSEWDSVNFRPQESILFQSEVQSTAQNGGLETFTFRTGGLPLNSNQQYILYLKAVFDGISGRGKLPQRLDNPLAGGGFVISNNGSDWFLGTRGDNGGVDLAFQATFSNSNVTVPEPSTIFGLSLVLVLTRIFKLNHLKK